MNNQDQIESMSSIYDEIGRVSADRDRCKIRLVAAETEVSQAEKTLAAVKTKAASEKAAIEATEIKIRNLCNKIK